MSYFALMCSVVDEADTRLGPSVQACPGCSHDMRQAEFSEPAETDCRRPGSWKLQTGGQQVRAP